MKYVFAIIVLLLFMTACGPRNLDFVKYKGTEGLVIEFAENAPPEKVYEATLFPVKVEITNEGARDVLYDDMILRFASDPLYVQENINYPFDFLSLDQDHESIPGKSLSFPIGDKRLFSIPIESSFAVKPIYGARESPTTQIITSLCYRYTTTAGAEVCINTDIYSDGARQQACNQVDISFSGGQGAPIAINYIEVMSFPVIDTLLGIESIRPHFVIHMKDVGEGRIIGHDGLEMSTACFLKDISPDEINTVRVQAWLLDTPLECQPSEFVKLHMGTGEVRCSVPVNELTNPIYQRKQNFVTALVVNLSYIYTTTATADLEIVRVPGTQRPVIPELNVYADGQYTGYMYRGDDIVKDDQGYAYTECRYYAEHPDEAPSELRGINSDFSCACTFDRCVQLKGSNRCFAGGYCPDALECCTDERIVVSEGELFSIMTPDGTRVPNVGPDPSKQQINSLLEILEKRYSLPKDVLKAIAYQESTWDNWPSGSNDGGKAHGILQIHEDYHPSYNITKGEQEASYNVDYGARYLKRLYGQYGDWPTAIKRYNGNDPVKTQQYYDTIRSHMNNKPWEQWV
ncbi:lytic transglycosylase domain-containing protein [Candidatus Woesearchaeota archaeon]|nr:lytic transglycosylase domain-containing protein [Candidatus Woesearchaeota archaeon]